MQLGVLQYSPWVPLCGVLIDQDNFQVKLYLHFTTTSCIMQLMASSSRRRQDNFNCKIT